MSHDYQNEMSLDTRSIDTAGEMAAESTNAVNAPVREENVTTRRVGNQQHYIRRGTFGVPPEIFVSADHAIGRMHYFKALAIETGTKRNPLNWIQPATMTAAYRSQTALAQSYMKDTTAISEAQLVYSGFVPIASMAAKAFAKAHEVGQHLGFSDWNGPQLDAREHSALRDAARAHHSPLAEGTSLDIASEALLAARRELEAAALDMAATVRGHTVTQLYDELHRAKGDKAEIEQRIAKAQQIVGYLSTAASLVGGAAGLIHDHVSVGAPGAPSVDLRDSDVAATKNGAGKAAQYGGYLGSAVAFGLRLYNESALVELEQRIDVITGLLAAHDKAVGLGQIKAAYNRFSGVEKRYAVAVRSYQASINDRRKTMATLGHTADTKVDKRGRNNKASDAMLWAATVMETRSVVGTAVEAGYSAKHPLNSIYETVAMHRARPWGTLEDASGKSNTPRREPAGPDLIGLEEMKHAVNWWLEGAPQVQQALGRSAMEVEPIMQSVGFTGAY